jgi:ketosteroid isomerase-like protein
MHVYRLRNGKIVGFEEFVDTAAQASGFTPDAAIR